jgi:hypothetical protein
LLRPVNPRRDVGPFIDEPVAGQDRLRRSSLERKVTCRSSLAWR